MATHRRRFARGRPHHPSLNASGRFQHLQVFPYSAHELDPNGQAIVVKPAGHGYHRAVQQREAVCLGEPLNVVAELHASCARDISQIHIERRDHHTRRGHDVEVSEKVISVVPHAAERVVCLEQDARVSQNEVA
eukprot:CAMPEP_0185271616 /NCGR_PEP_ID=MMETSP1359-20130426/45186_1 /TAXON_ID=552665 /ORGANISM="Bigelowiella longifila, Strain CCMP242" /LENGTH=133 /DNA_ID=CAMNT_0027863609 /DNA_START=365 /DNA_END=766 /DNA_ORIENTATION=-